jgi:hypothetical protein
MRALTAALILLTGCAGSPPPPVPVVGTEADLSALDGRWEGEYWSTGTGRNGSILFQVAADSHAASGDVVMVPRGSNRPLHRAHEGRDSEVTIPTTQVLTIRFVRIAGGQVSGELEPYHEPECDCNLFTRFIGRLAGDTIKGTYETSGGGGQDRASGEWRAVRR